MTGKHRRPRVGLAAALGFALIVVLLTIASTGAASTRVRSDDGEHEGHHGDETPGAVHHDVSPPLRDLVPILDRSTQNKEKFEPPQRRPPAGRWQAYRRMANPLLAWRPPQAPAWRFRRMGRDSSAQQELFEFSPRRHERRGRPEPLRADRQLELRGLQQVGHGALRAGADEHALERLRRRLPDEQRRRPDRPVRQARQPLDHQPVLGVVDAVPSVRRRLDDRRPDRLVLPLLVPVRDFPDYPKLGVWPDAYYMTFNMFNARAPFLGPEGLRVRPREDADGQAATQQCFTLSTSYGGLLPSDVDGPDAAAGRRAELRLELRHEHARPLEVPRRLDDAGEHHAHRPDQRSRSPRSAPPAAAAPASRSRGRPEARLARRPPHVPARVPQLRRPRVARRQPQRRAGSSRRRPLVRAAQPRRTPTVYQQGTYAPDASYRWMGSIAMDHAGDIALGFSVSSATFTRRSATPAGSRATRSGR